MKHPKKHRASSIAAFAVVITLLAGVPAARASITFGEAGDRTACPTTFNACYIGVDGSRSATVDAATTSTFSFVGLGVQSSELGAVTFPGTAPTGPTTPNGYLAVAPGASLQINGAFDASRPYDAAVIVGLGNNSTGTLLVQGGQVNTPVLVIGEYDGVRTSSGQVILANTNGASGNLSSSITATVDGTASGPLSGFTGIQIGRGLGSSGDLQIGYGDSVTATNASVSIGRAGTGSLEIGNGGTLSTAGSIYASTADVHGMATLSVGGTINLGTGGNLLVGVATDPTSGGLNQGFLTGSAPGAAVHGTATLTLTGDGISGGIVNGNVVIGAGGSIQGNGKVNGDLSSYGGYVSPGFSPGKITVDGDFVMDGGTYLVQIAGTGAGMTDFLDIAGSATLTDATILFQFIDGFSPSAGFTFDFLHAAGGVTASNLTFETEGLQPGFAFGTSIDEDGAFSFVARTDGVAVPEPETLALLAWGVVGAALLRRRRGLVPRRAEA